jgi:hypothetical protein
MRKMVLLAAMMAMAVMMLAAAPAMADDWDDWNDRHDDCWSWGFWVCGDNFDDHGFFFGGDGISQDFEQEAESGDVDQSFDVSSTGDNSNQTAGTQGVANTGNAQNQIGITQFGSDGDNHNDNNWWNNHNGDGSSDFDFDDVGSSIDVSPTNTTSSNQRVDQATSASD